ncbi:MAG: enoyl-CoA hydratase/isomerase family protein [Dehalococcoidia bacterium]|nr:enoyl-CoA hydratase/isomerase family protein [Dehalococcoidia bacterium]MCB9486301.1 enoyl-CoA hydratase/isomerase family protein [Thermoflexaceae bacterium]
MEYQDIIVEQREGVALVTLNRPEKLNALGPRIIHELLHFVETSERDDAVKVVVFTGNGRAFSAGADLTGDRSESDALDEAAGYRRMKEGAIGHWGVLFSALANYTKPTIAAVNGIAAGGGLSLSLICDMRIASTEARFIAVFVRRALVPDTGSSFTLPQLIGPARAMEMMFTGDEVTAEQADRWGLVNRVVPHEQLMTESMALATRVARGPSIAIELAKRLVTDQTRTGFTRQMQSEAWAQTVVGTIEDREEGIRAFLEKRQPQWKGR